MKGPNPAMAGSTWGWVRVGVLLAGLLAGLLLVGLVLASGQQTADAQDKPPGDQEDRSDPPDETGDPFYEDVPDGKELEGKRLGHILKHRVVEPSTHDQATVYQIIYVSKGTSGPRRNHKVPVSGAVLVPDVPWEGGGKRPIVGYTPGTRGTGDQCAPSKQLNPETVDPTAPDYDSPLTDLLLDQGIAVAITDHDGEGTPGLPTYLTGKGSAQNGLDVIRAAQGFKQAGLPDAGPVGVYGYSRGGQSAGWVAEIESDYAPELDLKGVATGGVVTDMNVQVNHLSGNPTGGAGVALAILSGLDRTYPGLKLEEYLTREGKRLVKDVEKKCIVNFLTDYGTTEVGDVTNPSVLTEERWIKKWDAQLLGTKAPEVPIFLYHAINDTIVPPAQGERIRESWCNQEEARPIFFKAYAGEHVSTIQDAAPDVATFFTQRFVGATPPLDNCDEVILPTP